MLQNMKTRLYSCRQTLRQFLKFRCTVEIPNNRPLRNDHTPCRDQCLYALACITCLIHPEQRPSSNPHPTTTFVAIFGQIEPSPKTTDPCKLTNKPASLSCVFAQWPSVCLVVFLKIFANTSLS